MVYRKSQQPYFWISVDIFHVKLNLLSKVLRQNIKTNRTSFVTVTIYVIYVLLKVPTSEPKKFLKWTSKHKHTKVRNIRRKTKLTFRLINLLKNVSYHKRLYKNLCDQDTF